MNYSFYKQAATLIGAYMQKRAEVVYGPQVGADGVMPVTDAVVPQNPPQITYSPPPDYSGERLNNDLQTYQKRKNRVENSAVESPVAGTSTGNTLMAMGTPYFLMSMASGKTKYGDLWNPMFPREAKETLRNFRNTNQEIMAPFYSDAGYATKYGVPKPPMSRSMWSAGGRALNLGFMGMWGAGIPGEWEHGIETLSNPDSTWGEVYHDLGMPTISTYAFVTEVAKSPLAMRALARVGVTPKVAPYLAQKNPMLFKGMVLDAITQLVAEEFKYGAAQMTAEDQRLMEWANMYAASRVTDPAYMYNPEAASQAYDTKTHEGFHGSGELGKPSSILAWQMGQTPKETMNSKGELENTNDAGMWGLPLLIASAPDYNLRTGSETVQKAFNSAVSNQTNALHPYTPRTGKYLMTEDTVITYDDEGVPHKQKIMRPMKYYEFLRMKEEDVKRLHPDAQLEYMQPVDENMMLNREHMRTTSPHNDPKNIFGWGGEAVLWDPGASIKRTGEAIANSPVGQAVGTIVEENRKLKETEKEIEKTMPPFWRGLFNGVMND